MARVSNHESPLLRNCALALLAPLLSLWRKRAFLVETTRQRLARRYTQTLLGPIWLLAQPLLYLLAIGFVRVAVFDKAWTRPDGSTSTGAEFVIAMFMGLSVFWLISEPVGRASGVVREYRGIIRHEPVAVDVLVATIVFEAIVNFGIRLALLLTGSLIVLHGLPPAFLLVPLAVLPLILLAFGLTWILARIGTFVRDLDQLIPPLLTAALFLSAVFYPLDSLPPDLQPWFLANPIALTIEQARNAWLWGIWPDPLGIAWLLGGGYLIMWIGWNWFIRAKGRFADAI